MKLAHLFIGILAGLALVMVSGCSDDGSPTNGGGDTLPAEVVATWDFQSVIVNGWAEALEDVLEWDANTVRATLVINSDGSYRYSEWNASGQEVWWESGTIAINGTSITWTPTADSDGSPDPAWSGTWSVTANIFSITRLEQSSTIRVTLTRPLSSAIPSAIVATWHYQSVTVNGSSESLRAFQDWDANTVRATLVVTSVGSYRYSEWNASDQELWWESGTVAFDGTNATFSPKANSDGPPDPAWNCTWGVSGSNLTLEFRSQDDDIVITLTK